MISLEDFRREVLGLNRHRKHKVSGSLGIYDGFKFYRRTRPKEHKYVLTESQYFSITRRINDLLAINLINGIDVKFPLRMGGLEIRKNERKVRIDNNGKVITNLPIDWNETLKLWNEDEEAFKNKTLVKVDEKEIFKVYYNRGLANYPNKSFYEFEVNRDLKKRLKQSIKDMRIEAMYLDKNRKYG